MINSNPINTQSINSWLTPVAGDIEDIQIWTIWLLNSIYNLSSLNDSVATELNDFPIPQNNGRGFLSYFKRWRRINLQITIKWNSKQDLIKNIDDLRQECFKSQNTLFYKWRKIKVNCVDFPENYNHYNITFLKANIWFDALEPFWYEQTNQSTSIDVRTSSFIEEISNQWTDITQPIIYLIIESWNITNTEIQVWENNLIIDEWLTEWDVLVVNSEELRVELNWNLIDYDWTFPEMKRWANFFNFNLTWTFELKTLIINRINYV